MNKYDYTEITQSIADTIVKCGGKALTKEQKMLLVASVSVWMERAYRDGIEWAKISSVHAQRSGVNWP